MFKAIFWDFGGVFTTSPFEAFNRYEASRGIPLDFIRGVNATNPETNAWAQFESSAVTPAEFDVLFEAESIALGHRIPGREVLPLLSGELRPRMVEALRLAKTRYANACITNNVRTGQGPSMARSSEKASSMADVMALFDHVIESSKEGVRKPNPRIYEMACERTGVAAYEVLYLDDLGINLKPAKAMGMTTIKVLNEAQTLAELAAHAHNVNVIKNSVADQQYPTTTAYWASGGSFAGFHQNSNTAMDPGTVLPTGGSQAHLNMQPFLTLNFCIALQGIFPSQN